MKTCENCGIEHDGNYGSGRFCSLKCSRGFSTKAKRKEINEKVSLKIRNYLENGEQIGCMKRNLNYPQEQKEFLCECGKKILSRRPRKFCSRKCHMKFNPPRVVWTPEKKEKLSLALKGKTGGLRDGGGRSKVFEYVSVFGQKMKLNNEEIKVAKILDTSGYKWNRNTTGFEYQYSANEMRKFYPDFYIEDLNLYIEYKGWLTDQMRHKMNDAIKRNNFDLKIIVGDNKRYVNDGISLIELESFLNL